MPQNRPHTTAELKAASLGEVLALPGWAEGVPFYARVRRASLTAMAAAGRIPNPLLAAAQSLYEGPRGGARPAFDETAKVVMAVVGQALAEPSLAQLAGAGIELTEEQIGEIYFYATGGARALARFRALAADRRARPAGGGDGGAPQQPAGA